MNIFTYGSLMFPMVWTRVVRGHYRHTEAAVSGFIRRAVIGEHYPVVIRSAPADIVSGILYFDVSSEDIDRLDLFEGPQYERCDTMISLPDKGTLPAGVYVLRDSHRSIAAASEWDPEQFRLTGLKPFLQHYLGFNLMTAEKF